MLYAKVLHDQNNIKYDNQLKLTAAYATDREILFKLINSKPKAPEEVVEDIETVEEVILNENIEEEVVQTIAQEEIVDEVVEVSEESIKEEIVEEVSDEIVAEVEIEAEIETETVEDTLHEEIEVETVEEETPQEPEAQEEVEEPVVEEKKESIADQILRKVKAIKEAKAASRESSGKSIADQILEKYSREDKKVEETVNANIEEQEVFVEDKVEEQIIEEHKEEDVKEELPVVEDYLTIEDLSNDVSDEIPDLSGLAAEISTQSVEEKVTQTEEVQAKEITEDDDILSFEIIEDKEEIEAIEIVSEKPEGVVVSGEDEVFELEGYTQEVAEENVESYSFEKWLKLLEENKSDKSREQIQDSKKIDKDENQEIDLIDKFISQGHKIKSKPAKEVSKSNFANKEGASEEGFMTETLAKIYIKQKYYEKLSLKYPKKNAYFASQIEKIKEIINQQE
jgi:hypothetical protein